MSHLFASAKRNAEFHNLFKQVPPDELLIDSYSCALSREILIHGRLYLSANYLCFNANILGWITNVTISLRDIVAIEKKMTALIIPNALEFSTLHSRHLFASLIRRDDTFIKISRIWKNSISEHPIPTTELLDQLLNNRKELQQEDADSGSIRKLRERRYTGSDSMIDSIFSDDRLSAAIVTPDPALLVRREYNFGLSRMRSFSRSVRSEDLEDIAFPSQEVLPVPPEDEEFSYLPCGCSFHYKNTLADRIVLKKYESILLSLLFPSDDCVIPSVYNSLLKELNANDVSFTPWKVYLARWERRSWSFKMPMNRLLMGNRYLDIKVTDSVAFRDERRTTVESLMSIDGVPGGTCYVKWKLCLSAPSKSSPCQDQCRATITATAAAPLGSWFKDSVKLALLAEIEEFWVRLLEKVVDSDEMAAEDQLRKAPRQSSSSFSYFDYTIFIQSSVKFSIGFSIFALLFSITFKWFSGTPARQSSSSVFDPTSHPMAGKIITQYQKFLQQNLPLEKLYSEVLGKASSSLKQVDVHVAELMDTLHHLRQVIPESVNQE